MSEDSARQQPLIQSVSRAVAILKCFTGNPELGLAELSRMVGLHKSTTAGIVNTLKAEGFLEQNEKTGRLRLGLELFSLAVQARHGLSEICEPYLNSLLDFTGETVNLAVLDKTEIVYIAKKESSHSIRISTSVGARLPVYCTAIGKSILAFMDRAKAEALLGRVVMTPYTDRTLTDRPALLAEMDRILNAGVAYDFEEYEQGVICIAAPLYYKKGDPIGAISVSGPTIRMDEAARKKITETLTGIAAQVNGELSRLA
ncbi:transcriptional regulator, IclR family [Sporobacter termitidis DSM 10068]|uniref:Glycerol operon regulatory protein n=1 Tax=Sporobacter termitidis DSM 10068 TaxID=1123282 RepID=A0A1M5YZV3_9FIRM|nr:IclR family transcriptional regulator [Sporobacter termitidis]SHI17537.1 transcriptional regulator, IclR family [Sporobacter termitidis DSM 10068]